MNRTFKAKVIVFSLFGLAAASAPASIFFNAPAAQADGISISIPPPDVSVVPSAETPILKEAPSLVISELSSLPAVKVVVTKPRARKTQKSAKTTYSCRRIPLTPNRPAKASAYDNRPTIQTVLYCD